MIKLGSSQESRKREVCIFTIVTEKKENIRFNDWNKSTG